MNKETKLTKHIYSKEVPREWKRLNKDAFHRLEFDTTIKFLKKYLQKKGLILDAGGGPGRYSIELAKIGYKVVLLDLVPEHLEFAKHKIKQAKVDKNIKDLIEGTITDLSRFPNNSFDAVLCLGGALSHIYPEADRKKAISELVRVAKKNAPLFVSVMGKLGTLTRFHRWVHELKNTQHFRRFYMKGDDYQWHGAAYSHFFELDELKSLFTKNVKFLESVGLDGLASPSQDELNKMAKKEPKAWKNWLEMHNKLCTNPLVVGISLHFMIIAKKT